MVSNCLRSKWADMSSVFLRNAAYKQKQYSKSGHWDFKYREFHHSEGPRPLSNRLVCTRTYWTESGLVKPVPFMAQPTCLGHQPARPWQVLQSTQLPWYHTSNFPSHRLKGITMNFAMFWATSHSQHQWVPLCWYSLCHPESIFYSYVIFVPFLHITLE